MYKVKIEITFKVINGDVTRQAVTGFKNVRKAIKAVLELYNVRRDQLEFIEGELI